MITEQHIEITHKLYQAKKSMKFLWGEKYQEKINEYRPIVEKFMAAGNCGALAAAPAILKKIEEKYPCEYGMLALAILATVVEMSESI